jgi:lysophospholipase L1-like esterase/pimeloyl-ACP methyl ester carboxylesterase
MKIDNIIKLNHNKMLSYILYGVFILSTFTSYAQERIRIAFVGNSITYGATIENRDVNSYPAQLGAMLGNNYLVQNFGKNGATLLQKGNIPYCKSDEYKRALDFNPSLVFIELGTNDSKPIDRIYLNEFVADYKHLIASFKQLSSHPRVVLLIPVPVFLEDSTGLSSSCVRDKIIPLIRQVVYETGCEVINLYNLMIDSSQLFPDKVHPYKAGATMIAKRLDEFIRMKSEKQVFLKHYLPSDTIPFNYYGFQGYDFTFRNRNAKIVVPKQIAPGHPWVWRARFWGHEPQTEIALLERGFHIVYCDVSELFGNDEALSIWDSYYQFLIHAGLSRKAVMEGMSRGGYYIYRWTAAYPDRVAAVYADAPVLDIKSWPGGKGKGEASPENWSIFLKDFKLTTEEEALHFKGNPIDQTDQIVKSGAPLLHVVGDADNIVPVAENTSLFEQKIKAAGGSIKVIHKPGVSHHPHSLQNPQPIVDFILSATGYNK